MAGGQTVEKEVTERRTGIIGRLWRRPVEEIVTAVTWPLVEEAEMLKKRAAMTKLKCLEVAQVAGEISGHWQKMKVLRRLEYLFCKLANLFLNLLLSDLLAIPVYYLLARIRQEGGAMVIPVSNLLLRTGP